MRRLLREWERESSEMHWARLLAKEFSSWQLRRNTEVCPPPKVPLTGHKEGACLVLVALVIMQTFSSSPLLLPSSPSATQCAYWTHLEHDSGQVPYVTSNSRVHRVGSVLCPWEKDCMGPLIWLSWSLNSSSILPCNLTELGKLMGGPWACDPSQTVEPPSVFSCGPGYWNRLVTILCSNWNIIVPSLVYFFLRLKKKNPAGFVLPLWYTSAFWCSPSLTILPVLHQVCDGPSQKLMTSALIFNLSFFWEMKINIFVISIVSLPIIDEMYWLSLPQVCRHHLSVGILE